MHMKLWSRGVWSSTAQRSDFRVDESNLVSCQALTNWLANSHSSLSNSCRSASLWHWHSNRRKYFHVRNGESVGVHLVNITPIFIKTPQTFDRPIACPEVYFGKNSLWSRGTCKPLERNSRSIGLSYEDNPYRVRWANRCMSRELA